MVTGLYFLLHPNPVPSIEIVKMASLTFSKSIVDRLKESMATALRLSNIHLYRLAQALLWFNDGMGAGEISSLIGVCNRTIENVHV